MKPERKPQPWSRLTVIVPGAVAGTIGFALGTVGSFSAAFGMGTVCTDFNPPHACAVLNRWLITGFIGQWVLVIVTAVLLVIGLKRPQSRQRIAIAGWVIVAFTIAWYVVYVYGGWHTYKHPKT
jgi:hypothetical protein